jgi:hypothetical protein
MSCQLGARPVGRSCCGLQLLEGVWVCLPEDENGPGKAYGVGASWPAVEGGSMESEISSEGLEPLLRGQCGLRPRAILPGETGQTIPLSKSRRGQGKHHLPPSRPGHLPRVVRLPDVVTHRGIEWRRVRAMASKGLRSPKPMR